MTLARMSSPSILFVWFFCFSNEKVEKTQLEEEEEVSKWGGGGGFATPRKYEEKAQKITPQYNK